MPQFAVLSIYGFNLWQPRFRKQHRAKHRPPCHLIAICDSEDDAIALARKHWVDKLHATERDVPAARKLNVDRDAVGVVLTFRFLANYPAYLIQPVPT